MSSVLVESDCRSMLESLGFPDIVVDAWEAEGVTELLPIQKEAFAANVLDHISSLIIGPTTSGKTFIGEAACVKHALEKRRCLFLVPFKALAEEKYQEFQLKYGRPEIGADILISTADRRDRDRQLAAGDFNIAILTYEKLSALLVIHPSLLKNAGAIIVDEIQMIRAESRGAELELLLTRARQIAPDLQVIGLSAAVSELNGFDEWLGAQVVRNEHRPVPLREGVILPNGRFEYLEWQEVDKTPGVETLPSLIGETEESLAISLAAQLLEDESEQVLVFANAVSRTQGLAVAIANRVQGLVPATDTIKGLAGLENSESVEALTESLQSAVAFHNSDLTLEERLAVEAGFRHGHIRCIVSTSTLSMGVNLPASTVMIVKPTKWTREAGSWDEVPISVAEYRNMSGRAGRFGLRTDSFGRSVLIAKSPLDQKALLKRYVNGTPEPLESAFLKRPLAVFLLRVFASGLCDNPNGAQRFLLKTFAARQVWNTEESQEKLAEEIHRAISQLTVYKLVEVKDDKVHVTDLGVICASSGLQLESFGQLLSLVKSSNTSAVDIAHLASRGKDTGPDGGVGIRLSSDEYHGRRPHFVRVLRDWCTTFVGPLTELLLDRFEDGSAPTYEQGKELKYQCVAMAYVTGVASREIERQLGVSAGKARAIGSMCSWLSDTAAKAAWATGKIDEAKALKSWLNGFCTVVRKRRCSCRAYHTIFTVANVNSL